MQGSNILTAFLRGCVLALLLLASSTLLAREDLSGNWREEYNDVVYSPDQWGAHCGEFPRSTGKEKRNLVFTVEDRGVDLIFKSFTGSFSASACQSANPSIKAKERNLKDELFLVNCATSETSDSYESGLYSFRIISSSQIEYRETTRTSKNLPEGLCVNTKRIRRAYIKESGPAPGTLPSEPIAKTQPPEPVVGTKVMEPTSNQTPPPKTPEDDPCKRPGPPASLVITPEQAAGAPGEKICLAVRIKDKHGCATSGPIVLVSNKPVGSWILTPDNCLALSPKATPGIFPIELESGKAKAVVRLTVEKKTPAVRGASDVKVQPGDHPPAATQDQPPSRDGGESQEPVATALPVAETKPLDEAPVPAHPGTAEPVSIPVDTPSAPPWLVPAGIAGGGVLLVALLTLWYLGRKRHHAKAPEGAPPGAKAAVTPQQASLGPAPATQKTTTIFCTNCGRSIPGEAKFCPFDRTPIHREGSPTLPSAPVCPTCKRLLPSGAKFCPFDRTKLG